jgi:uncharacterized protein (DUF362 family)
MKNNNDLNRKGFLKSVGLIFGAWFIAACSKVGINIAENTEVPTKGPTDTPTNEPTEISVTENPTEENTEQVMENNGKTKIAFVKTADRRFGVQKSIELLGINPAEGKSVFLKPNFNSADPAPGSTHPDVLREMILQLQQLGSAQIIIGDRSGMGDTRKAMEYIGVFDIADELGVDVKVFDDLGADDWVKINTDGSYWKNGFYFAKPSLDADVIVQACCLKTHQYGGHFTMSLKNSVGLVAKRFPGNNHNFMSDLHGSDHQRKMIAEINLVYEPGFVVMDGVEAFVDGGPHDGTRVNSNVVLAGTDMVALDAVGVAILRYFGTTPEVSAGSVFEQEQIATAVELGLGVESADMIEFVTDGDESAEYAEEIRQILIA